jgi:glycosyltransferase involved in cell wall biosynthesis
MKICYLADAPNVHTQKWARFFVERDNEVHVISFRPAVIGGAQVHFIHASFGRAGYVLAANRVRKLVWHIAPDILHAQHATSYGLVGALAGYHPFLISSWGSDVVWSPRQFFLFDWMLRYNFRQADQVTATSHMLAQATASFCPPGTHVHVIPFGVDTDVFSPPTEKLRGADRPLTIGIVKTLRPRYGIRELIRAFHQISSGFPATRLVIVGGGEQYAELQTLIANLGMEECITLAGQAGHEQIPHYLQSFDLFVVPSLTDRESFGVAAVEAAACGLPVIAARVGGLPEVVLDGQTGLLVTPGDVNALAAAMARLLSEPELRARMGQAGRRFVLEHYRWEDNASLMERLYKEVVSTCRHG